MRRVKDKDEIVAIPVQANSVPVPPALAYNTPPALPPPCEALEELFHSPAPFKLPFPNGVPVLAPTAAAEGVPALEPAEEPIGPTEPPAPNNAPPPPPPEAETPTGFEEEEEEVEAWAP